MKWMLPAGMLCLSLTMLAQSPVNQLKVSVDSLRQLLKIPGLSIAFIKDDQVTWTEGFGWADVEKKIKTTAHTPYPVASLTKPIAATLFLQLLEAGRVLLDDPLCNFHRHFETDRVRIKHILTHTAAMFSPGMKPGDAYQYSGSFYGYLAFVIAKLKGRPFRDELVYSVLEPLRMKESVPGQDVFTGPSVPYSKRIKRRYQRTLLHLAKPYTLYGTSEMILSPYPPRFIGSSAGLLSTVTDLAKFDKAIDRHTLIRPETQQLAWTNALTNDGQQIPYGLGWFVQEVNGMKVVWHYGQWPTFSGLWLKVPEKHITYILLCNSNAMSAPFDLDKGDVLQSAFALLLLKTFIPSNDYIPLRQKADSSIQAYLRDHMAKKGAVDR